MLLPSSCPPQPCPSPDPSLYKDALTDLTGDAERLPVEGHHGTWLGHKVPTASWAPGPLAFSPASTQNCPVGVGVSLLAGLAGRDWSEGWKVHWASLARTPIALSSLDPDPEEPEEAAGKR